MRIARALAVIGLLALCGCTPTALPKQIAEPDPPLASDHTSAIAEVYSRCFDDLGMNDLEMVLMPSERADIDGYVTVQGNGQTLAFTVSDSVNGELVNSPANDETEALLNSVGCSVGDG